jgi:hypothetical protein
MFSCVRNLYIIPKMDGIHELGVRYCINPRAVAGHDAGGWAKGHMWHFLQLWFRDRHPYGIMT